ncbi:CTD kinase subunit alpha [Psilocybe cubensis]|uniref:CTD kinase subunit alpha n=2 Tax=Psilocybe cubensis TaxID=181762 RepID=A0ACB8H3X1_PSICU|nr:CTD kinase subunit alpha [Psilocybe cubensis]KAH9482688.1 CTD kinase subunit alpha [Psilocybe cubensis]
MRQGKNKRSRGSKDADVDIYMRVGDDISPETYSRPHNSFHHPESYRASNAGRGTYSSGRDMSSGSRRGGDWRHAELDHERYSFTDPFARGERAQYDDSGPRSSGGWGPVNDSYVQSRNSWPPRYDNGASSSSYAEPSTWTVPDHPSYDSSRIPYHDRWETNEPRESIDDWNPEPMRNDHRTDRRHHDWRPDSQRDKNSGHRFRSDSGWDSRRRDRNWTNEPIGRHNDLPPDKRQAGTEDRSWEPAASWVSSTTNDYSQQRGQNGQRSYHHQRPKRVQNYNKHRREWRADDGELNNWTRRDTSRGGVNKTFPNQNFAKRKHLRSPSRSRSRSRSPTESYISHRSSRGRSHSRSVSPANKRRRRDSSPITLQSQTPSERSLNRSHYKPEKQVSRSPSPQRISSHRSPPNFTGRRRSPSAVSSTGSDRSRSKSPARSVHRLPPNHHPPVTITNVYSRNNGTTPRKEVEDYKNGKSRSQKHRKGRESQAQTVEREYEYFGNVDHSSQNSAAAAPPIGIHTAAAVSMPPPMSVPLSHPPRPQYTPQEYNTSGQTWIPDAKIDLPGKPNRNINTRHAGFRPIGKGDSSLKRFFPGDDDEMDPADEVNTSPRMSESAIEKQTSMSYPHQSHRISDYHEWESPLHPAELWRADNPYSRSTAGSRQTSSLDLESAACLPKQGIPPIIPPPHAHHTDSEMTTSANNIHLLTSSADDLERRSPHFADSTDQPILTSNDMQLSTPSDNHDVSSAVGHSLASNKDLYKIISQVGEGTFGKVYKARNTITGNYVALKRIRMESEKDGFPVTAMREIKLLQSLRQENVVRLYEMMVSNGSVYMVFEYMDHDLTGVLSQTQFVFERQHLKSLCHQMLAGLAYLHRKGVIHRDIKGSNILINNRGELKLADFGLARFYQKRRRADYTNRVITLWYRPPELLFGATIYGPEVDMWSAGCIMLELFVKKPVFQGADEIHQLEVIYKLMGTPTPERWTDVVNLPWYELVKPQQPMGSKFRESFQKYMSPAALDLAEQLLAFDPAERITAMQAMNAPYFTQEYPSATPPVGLIDIKGEWHELETKRERQKRKEQKNAT